MSLAVRGLLAVAFIAVLLTGCNGPPGTSDRPSTSSTSTSPDPTSTGAHFVQNFTLTLGPYPEQVPAGTVFDNCIFLRADSAVKDLRGNISLDWVPQSPLTGELDLRVSAEAGTVRLATGRGGPPRELRADALPDSISGIIAIHAQRSVQDIAVAQEVVVSLSLMFNATGPQANPAYCSSSI